MLLAGDADGRLWSGNWYYPVNSYQIYIPPRIYCTQKTSELLSGTARLIADTRDGLGNSSPLVLLRQSSRIDNHCLNIRTKTRQAVLPPHRTAASLPSCTAILVRSIARIRFESLRRLEKGATKQRSNSIIAWTWTGVGDSVETDVDNEKQKPGLSRHLSLLRQSWRGPIRRYYKAV